MIAGVNTGKWFYEATVLAPQPMGDLPAAAVRIGFSQIYGLPI